MDEYIYSQSIHKDFHEIINYIIKYLKECYGKHYLESFFEKAAAYIYKPLIERIKNNGLLEMKKHLERTFSMEKGVYELTYNTDELVFIVKKCPAIWHMKDKKIKIDKDFCKTSTDIVSKTISQKCGYCYSVQFNQKNGKCIQKFWKE